jgi:CRISPR-associated Cas5-like protein
VPFATWRKGYSIKFGETYGVPPISTIIGFILSFVGKEQYLNKSSYFNVKELKRKTNYKNVKITFGVKELKHPNSIIKTIHTFKAKNDENIINGIKYSIENVKNKKLEKIEVLCDNDVLIYIDNDELEKDIKKAINGEIERHSCLSLGKSDDLVSSIDLVDGECIKDYLMFNTKTKDSVVEKICLPFHTDHFTDNTKYIWGSLDYGYLDKSNILCCDI